MIQFKENQLKLAKQLLLTGNSVSIKMKTYKLPAFAGPDSPRVRLASRRSRWSLKLL